MKSEETEAGESSEETEAGEPSEETEAGEPVEARLDYTLKTVFQKGKRTKSLTSS